jgi:hypothetical protein
LLGESILDSDLIIILILLRAALPLWSLLWLQNNGNLRLFNLDLLSLRIFTCNTSIFIFKLDLTRVYLFELNLLLNYFLGWCGGLNLLAFLKHSWHLIVNSLRRILQIKHIFTLLDCDLRVLCQINITLTFSPSHK